MSRQERFAKLLACSGKLFFHCHSGLQALGERAFLNGSDHLQKSKTLAAQRRGCLLITHRTVPAQYEPQLAVF